MSLSNNPIWDQITKGSIGIWDDDYKLIHSLQNNKSLLFNLKEDPEELNNLFYYEPGISNRLLEVIRVELSKTNERFSKGKR